MAMLPSDYTEFPPEIVLKPQALIGISGLDVVNNAVHKAVWDALSNNRRPDRSSIQFKLLTSTFEFPVVKPKRNSYEWYIPKGILKKNWINKRISLIPAVIVIFYDVEWNDPQWNEKIIECASRVQSIRAAVEGHATRVAVVVVQSGHTPPPSEFMLGAERAQALCSACEIPSKSLFVLPQSDNLMGYIIRLENAFYDIAQNYYHYETKNIKQHKDHLNKTTHQYLFVRHQFKLGFLNELKQDHNTAHKHYLLAYNNLIETRTVETNINEVRTVAGYINYKLCKLLFTVNMPRDAIAQLKTHIERYKSRIGSTELLFEHYAWVARQYSAFAELFDEAIRAGLPAIQTQHPGFYYQLAAQFSVKRRQAMRSVCAEVLQYPPGPDPLVGFIEFYGQRPWRPGRLSVDPHDPQKEQLAINALQFNEKTFNHSLMIISFLGSAITQFKTFHSPRMRKQLVVEMANEYYFCADFGKALTLLSHMLWDYRKERWWFLASHVLNRALQCAYLSAKVQDYLQLCIEALSPNIQVYNNDKLRIFKNLKSVLNVNIPDPEPEIPASSQNKAFELWQTAIEKDPWNVSLEMNNLSSFLQVKPLFKHQKQKVDEEVIIALYVRLFNASSLKIKKSYITLTSQTETIEIPVSDNGQSDIILEGNKVKIFLCNFKANAKDSGSDIHIKQVTFFLDSDNKRNITMNFKMDDKICIEALKHPELLHFIQSPQTDLQFECLVPITSCHLTARECKMSLNVINSSPALQGEWFPIQFTVTNNEQCDVNDLQISISLPISSDNPNPESATELSFAAGEAQTQPLHVNLQSQHLAQSSSIEHTFYFKSNRTTTIMIQIKVSYYVNLPKSSKIDCVKDFTVKVDVVKPFELLTKFVSMNFKPINKCLVADPFILIPQIKILSPWNLIIVDTELDLSDCFKYTDTSKPSSCIANVEVSNSNIAADAICLQAKHKPKDSLVRVGLYNVKWKRSNCDSSPVMSSIALNSLPVDICPISIQVHYPEVIQMQTSVQFKCILSGIWDTPITLALSMEGSDAYMFSGFRKQTVTIPPHDQVELCYNIHPLVAGDTMPPRLIGTLVGDQIYQEAINEIFYKNFPQNIFVMPKYNN